MILCIWLWYVYENSEKMMVDFYNCVNYLSEWNGNFIILKGTGHTFCSGFDLQAAPRYFISSMKLGSWFQPSYTKDPKGKLLLSEFMQDTCNRFKRLPIPSLSFIEGYAMGGGAEMTTCTDFRYFKMKLSYKIRIESCRRMPRWSLSTRHWDYHPLGEDLPDWQRSSERRMYF